MDRGGPRAATADAAARGDPHPPRPGDPPMGPREVEASPLPLAEPQIYAVKIAEQTSAGLETQRVTVFSFIMARRGPWLAAQANLREHASPLTTFGRSGYLGIVSQRHSAEESGVRRRRRRRNRPGNAQAAGTARVMTLWKEARLVKGVAHRRGQPREAGNLSGHGTEGASANSRAAIPRRGVAAGACSRPAGP
jgi:hypothetical protein